MIKPKLIFSVSILSMFVSLAANADIASSGYVDQQVDTRLSSISGTTTGDGNVVTEISASGDTITATKGINAEVTSNKVTAVGTTDTATNEKYPSELAVANALDAKQDKIDGEVLTNTATGTNSFSTGDATPVASDASVAIGNGSAVSGDGKSIALGYRTNVTGMMGTALGAQATVEGDGGIAIGLAAGSSAENSIQIGTGENSEANTMSVGLSNNNYKLLNSDGTIPAERMPDTILTNTATGGYSFSTGDASPVATTKAIALGSEALANETQATSIGYRSNATASNAVAIGSNANATQQSAVVLGPFARSDGSGAVALGSGAASMGTQSIAIGSNSIADVDSAIQLGPGENSEANTLSIGLSNSNNYKLLNSDGTIPAERMPDDVLKNTNPSGFAIGGATGGYNGFAIGSGANGGGYGVAVGPSSSADNYSVSIGRGAVSSNSGIQIGQGTNSEANTFQVNSYKMLGSDGKIPVERLPAARIPVGSSSSPTSYATFWIE